MTISSLLEGLHTKWKERPSDVEIRGIAYDSRLVRKDFVFVAIRGYAVDGHDYIRDAIDRGAALIVAEYPEKMNDSARFGAEGKPAILYVTDSREALALISAAFYGHPSKSLSLIGITGTNGKTTTSFITKSIIEANGSRAGLLGTICYLTGNKSSVAGRTTPESLDLQRYLSEMVYNKMDYAILEVSSHALALKRVEGCSFKIAAFTGFSQDHLDFHGTMDEYLRAKSRLFSGLGSRGTAVMNVDDPEISRLAQTLDCNVITCGTSRKAMIRAENITQQGMEKKGHGNAMPCRLSFDICTPEGRYRVSSRLIGGFNVSNILVAAGIAYASGIKQEIIKRGIEEARPVEGRFENIDEGQNFLCIIDYAHTEDALKKLLEEARAVSVGRVITVFGCGGDRDRTKRPLMGAAASELSDIVIVTSDNPRSEDPSLIIKEIVRGMKRDNYRIEPDREESIIEAVSMASNGDIVVIAGKGHEDYQEVKGRRRRFSDKDVLRKALKRLRDQSG